MSKVRFLNVDLELRSSSPLLELKRELEAAMFSLGWTHGTEGFELRDQPTSVQQGIAEICEVADRLSSTARQEWGACSSRCLNVGIESGREQHATEFAISAAALRKMTALNLDLVWTVYGTNETQG